MAETLSGNDTPGYILIVDDSPESVRFLKSYLIHEGYRVEMASGGTQALEMIFHDPPDLVLLDMMMPGLNGREVLQILRHNPQTAEIAIIMLTAVDTVEDVVDCFELGADDYLTKPAEFEILLARVRTHVNLKRLRDQRRRDIARLRELSALKDKFLQIAAHDLRSPLQNMAIAVDVLSRLTPLVRDGFPGYEEVLLDLQHAIGTMRSIVDDFLDLQALQAGQIELEMRPVAINDLVRGVIRQFSTYAASKEIVVEEQLAPELPLCLGDPNRLNQITSNLVSNAIKFSPAHSRVIVRTRLTNGAALRVEVEDNGPGIPANEMPLLFEEFARLSNKPTGGEKSSGVGLSISRHLVELHGGHIGAESELDKGSTFWYELPIAGDM